MVNYFFNRSGDLGCAQGAGTLFESKADVKS